jgi:hypothetical protein
VAALLGTRRGVPHCRIVLIVRCRSY